MPRPQPDREPEANLGEVRKGCKVWIRYITGWRPCVVEREADIPRGRSRVRLAFVSGKQRGCWRYPGEHVWIGRKPRRSKVHQLEAFS